MHCTISFSPLRINTAAGKHRLARLSPQSRSSVRKRKRLEFVQAPHGRGRLEGLVVDARGVQAAAFLERVFGDGRKEFLDILLRRNKGPQIVPVPTEVPQVRLRRTRLVGVRAQVNKQRPAGCRARPGRDVADLGGEMNLPVLDSNGVQLSALTKVVDLLARALLRRAAEVGQEVVAVGVDLEGLPVGLVPDRKSV